MSRGREGWHQTGRGRRMAKGGGRTRWGIILALVAVVGAGLVLARSSLFLGTLDRGRAAYDRGDWRTASSLAAARLKEAPADRDALVLLARATARQDRHDSARSLYSRLGGASAMQA